MKKKKAFDLRELQQTLFSDFLPYGFWFWIVNFRKWHKFQMNVIVMLEKLSFIWKLLLQTGKKK